MSSKWKKIKILGDGSSGTVYLAEKGDSLDHDASSSIAVKSTDLQRSHPLKVEKLFLRALKGCPFIVHCFGDDVSTEEGKRFYNLLLEYAPGGTLFDLIRLRGGKMPEAEVAGYAWMLLTALSHAHAEGIVHCDVKPQNVLVCPTRDGRYNQLKLADFGNGKRAGMRQIYTHPMKSYNRGTLIYASPESVASGIHEPPADIWSLGCTILEMITGFPAWPLHSALDLDTLIRWRSPSIPLNIPLLAQNFLRRCFERNPRTRWTADMLLRHPFITQNFSGFSHSLEEQRLAPGNPFGDFDDMVTLKDLFSTEPREQCPYLEYQLFPSKLAQRSRPLFPGGCGQELIRSVCV